jgi:amino acid transporter
VESKQDEGLRRDIGFGGSAFLSFNGIVGAGIFALPGTLFLQFGTFSPWLFPIFGLLILIVALPFARLASHFPGSGGPAAYAAVYGPAASFQAGWLYYVARVTALAANSNVFATYAATLWPPIGEGVGRVVTILLLCALLTFINMVGVKRAIRALDLLTLLKGLPLLILAIWALAASDMIPAPGPLPEIGQFEAAALLVLYAFIGFENSVVPAGETANAQRTIPRALLATIIATACLYFLIQLAYVSVMPAGAPADAPLVAFGTLLAGPTGALLITAAALSSVMGNVSAGLTSTSRVTFALANRDLLPRWFGIVSERYRTPANSILFMGLLVALLAISGSFVWLAVVSTLARLFVYSISIASLPPAERASGKPAGAAIFLLMIPALGICLWAALQSDWAAWRMLLILLMLGLLLYVVARRQAVRRARAQP